MGRYSGVFLTWGGARGLAVAVAVLAIAGCDNAATTETTAPATTSAASTPAPATPAPSADPIPLVAANIGHESGFAYVYALPFSPSTRKVKVFEDGKELGPEDSIHEEIRTKGQGRYSHWDNNGGSTIYFSASDNSNPMTNGKTYEVR